MAVMRQARGKRRPVIESKKTALLALGDGFPKNLLFIPKFENFMFYLGKIHTR